MIGGIIAILSFSIWGYVFWMLIGVPIKCIMQRRRYQKNYLLVCQMIDKENAEKPPGLPRTPHPQERTWWDY